MREGGESFQDEKEHEEILHKSGGRGKLKLPLQHLKFPSSADQGSRESGCRRFTFLPHGEPVCPIYMVCAAEL